MIKPRADHSRIPCRACRIIKPRAARRLQINGSPGPCVRGRAHPCRRDVRATVPVMARRILLSPSAGRPVGTLVNSGNRTHIDRRVAQCETGFSSWPRSPSLHISWPIRASSPRLWLGLRDCFNDQIAPRLSSRCVAIIQRSEKLWGPTDLWLSLPAFDHYR